MTLIYSNILLFIFLQNLVYAQNFCRHAFYSKLTILLTVKCLIVALVRPGTHIRDLPICLTGGPYGTVTSTRDCG